MELVKFDRYEVMKLDKLVAADWNYKEDDAELSEKLANNLKRNGQIENIIVRELDTGFYEVVNGNHRFGAMKQLGAKKIVVCNLGKISSEEAQRIAIETNETRYKSDPLKLGALIAEISKSVPMVDLAQTMPYNEETLKLMGSAANFSWDQFNASTSTNSEGSSDENWETFKVRLPLEVKEMFEAAINKLKRSIERITQRPCTDEIRPIECLSIAVNEMKDEELDAMLT